ncbi:MAG: family 2A encapsulin nanocompartment cargo protein cysteine desulfurase [Nakamurella sp.]
MPGLAGLQVAPPGELTPPLFGIAAPLPSAGFPGVPASDQALAGAPTPSAPDVSTAQPFSTIGGISPPVLPMVPAVPGVTGANGLPREAGGLNPYSAAEVPGLDVDQVPGDTPDDVTRGLPVPTIPQPPVAVPDPPAPVPTPSTPYYFVAESSPYRGAADHGLDSLIADALKPVQVEPPPMDPSTGATGGRTELFGHPSGPVTPADPGPIDSGLPSAAFYFLDRPTAAAAPANRANSTDRHAPFDINRVRRDFPILSERVNGKPLVWLDNAATTQKPQAVLDRLAHFYSHENSNIHRAAHELAARATDAYEGARKTVARFIGAQSEKNIIFVRGATEAINLVAKTWGKANIRRGDEIILSHLEHHANIVPWQMLVAETGAKLRIIPVDDSGQLIMSEYGRLLSEKTKMVAVTQVSNALGTVTPVREVVEMGHRAGACVLIDGAQSVPHLRVNMQTLGADFFVFSGHKIFGPTGIGVVYGRQEVLETMPPWEGGGNMIADVTFEKTEYQKPPGRFEAGTGNIADAVGLGAALDYVSRLGLETIAQYEHALLEYATPRMCAVPGLRMIGTATAKASVLSFVLDGYRTEEVGSALNQEGIAVRSGHHCAQPILRRFGLETTVRPSVAFYNTFDEIDLLVSVLHRLAAGRGRR